MNLLLLGGTAEARELAEALADRPSIHAVLSLAGATRHPAALPIATRRGGFGGVAGLCAYLRDQAVDLVIDATHPFADTMSAHAATACARRGVALWRLERPAWTPRPDEHWMSVVDADRAAACLAMFGRRVFLTVGARSLAPFEAVPDKHWLIRSIEAPEPEPRFADWTLIRARPPFSRADEQTLLTDHAVNVLVTKNSGAPAMRTKLDAAHALDVPVLMIERPAPAVADHCFLTSPDLLDALDAHQKSAGYSRGV